MEGKMKRTLARLLVVIMVVTMMPVSGYGAVSSTDNYKIGTTGYASLRDAVAAVQNGQTIIALKNNENVATVDDATKSFTLDLNGCTVESTNLSRIVTVDNGNVTITNGIIASTGPAIAVTGGTVTLDGVTVKNTKGTHNAVALSGGELHIINAEITVEGETTKKAVDKESGGTVSFGTCTDYPADWADLTSFTAEEKEPRFRLGTTGYYDFTRAVDAATDNSVITVVQNATVDESEDGVQVEIPMRGYANGITINLNGNTLTTKGTLYIQDPLKLMNGTLDVNGTVKVFLDGGTQQKVTFDQIHLKTTGNIIKAEGNVILGPGDYETTSTTGGMDDPSGLIAIADDYATDADTDNWQTIQSVHVGKDLSYYYSETEPAIANNGEPARGTVKAYDGEKLLEEGVDFEVEYTNNILPGVATATIIGIGDYGGKLVKEMPVLAGAVPNVRTQYTCDAISLFWNAVETSTGEATIYDVKLIDKTNNYAVVEKIETTERAAVFSNLTTGNEYIIQISAGFMLGGSLRNGQITPIDVTPSHKPVVDPAVPATCTEPGLTEGSHCEYCLTRIVEQTSIPSGHSWNEATCTEPKTCRLCQTTEGSALGHTPGAAATCTTAQTCTVCKATLKSATGHTPGDTQVTVKATVSKDGKIETKCTACSTVLDTATIKKASKVSLSTASYTYNGKAKSPKIVVKDSAGKTISSKYYTVSKPSGRKSIGKYTYTVKFKGDYTGTKKLTLTIKPVKPTIQTPKAAKKAVTVKWKKGKKAQVTGYQVMVATNSKFTKNKKTATVKGYTKVSKKMTGLKAKTKYYVKVRTYKTVKGVKIYSDWSKVKTLKTK